MATPLFHHRRKLPSAGTTTAAAAAVAGGNGGLSFSGKDAYDDVFAGGLMPPRFDGGAGGSSFSSGRVAAEDYAEIFGGKNGTRGSSIPVLDLPELDGRNGSVDVRSSGGKLDYSMIFGGFDGGGGGGDDGAGAVPAYEELFHGVKKAKTNIKAKSKISTGTASPLKGSDRSNSSENIKRQPHETSDLILDGAKQFNMCYHKTGERTKDVLNGTTHIAQLDAVPGFTYVFDESDHLRMAQQETAKPPVQVEVNHNENSSNRMQKTQQDKAMPPVKVEVKNRSSCDDISDGKSGSKTKWQLPTANAFEGLVKHKGELPGDATYSRDKLHNVDEVDLKSSPSSSSSNLKDSKGYSKGLKSSSFGPKIEASEVAGGYATPLSDDELDMNSAAAASAAALRKAIEQAQESIRIAKQIMERKRDSLQTSRSFSKDSLNTIDRREINNAQEPDNSGENNEKEACKSPENEVQDSIKFNQELGLKCGEVVSAFTRKEKTATGRQPEAEKNSERRSEAETTSENVEIDENKGVVAMWFTQLLNNGKHRVAALASDLVGRRNDVLQHTENAEEVKLAKVTLECDNTGDLDSVDGIVQKNSDSKLNVLRRSDEFEKNVDNSDLSQCVNEDKPGETLDFAQKNEVTKSSEDGLDTEEKCEMNFQDSYETSSSRCELGKDLPDNELLKPEEKFFKQEAGRKLLDFSVGDENDGKLDEVETSKKNEEIHLLVGNEHEPKRVTDYVIDGKRQEDDLEESLEGYHQQESEEQRSTESVEGEENQILSKLEDVWEGIDRRPAGSHENEEGGSMDEDASNSSVNQKIEENEVLQGRAECPIGNLSEDVYEDSTGAAFDAYHGADFVDILETCRSEVESIGKQTSQPEIRNHEEDEDLAGLTEQSSQLEGKSDEEDAHNLGVSEYFQEFDGITKAPEAVGEASKLKGEQMLETSYVDHVSARENIVERLTQGIPDAAEEAATHGSTYMVDEPDTSYVDHIDAQENIVERLTQDVPDAAEETASVGSTNLFDELELSDDSETDGSINNGIELDAKDIEYMTEASAVNNPSNFDYSVLNVQSQIHENDKKSESPLNTDNHDDGSVSELYGQSPIEESEGESESSMDTEYSHGFVHESAGNAENVTVDKIVSEKKIEKDNNVRFEKGERIKSEKEPESIHFAGEEDLKSQKEIKTGQSSKNCEENVGKDFVKEEKETKETVQKEGAGKDCIRRREATKRDRERVKDRMAVDRAIRETRERAFAEVRERAERAAVEKAIAEVRQRVMAEAREKLDRVSTGTQSPIDKASIAARLRAERAAVERATAEARERALEKALSQKTTSETRAQPEKSAAGKFSDAPRDAKMKHCYSSPELENFDGTSNESAQRLKARSEKNQRIMERAAKALAEKNLRDVLAQREQAQKNRLAETLDAEIKRWANGKQGNLRALLSTLQYILGPNSGWQPVSLTEIVTTAAVKKAYRKATLYVHPDKLQQRGASIQQKYICEKVFDLLKAAWNKFNSEER